MALSTCTISGSLRGPDGSALAAVNIYAYSSKAYFYGDGTLIPAYQVSTQTDNSGNWSLALVETTSTGRTVVIAFDMPTGTVERQRKEYTITVPNTATATLASLTTEQ